MIVLLFSVCCKPLLFFGYGGFSFVPLAFFFFSKFHFNLEHSLNKSELECFSFLAGFKWAALVSDHLVGTTLHFCELFQ